MRILIAPDKFKGSLTSPQVAKALKAGYLEVWPDAQIETISIADGGEGTAEIFKSALHGEWMDAECHDALGRSMTGRYAWVEEKKLAVLEMSEASGLARLRREELDPLAASTFGTGELMRAALERGAGELLVGLGGSATNDGGAGIAAALGWKFLDAQGEEIAPHPGNFLKMTKIIPPQNPFDGVKVSGLSDVKNPLLGPEGATRVFGKQKGASPAQLEMLEKSLGHLAELCRSQLGGDFVESPGAGAAGGLGFGLMTFCGAQLRGGFAAIADLLGIEEMVKRADLIVTGEGRLDAQSDQGKAPVELARLARKHGKPIIAFAGSIEDGGNSLFTACRPISEKPLPLEESQRRAAELLRGAAARAARASGPVSL